MKRKIKTIGGQDYLILGSTTESERGMVVFQSFTVPGGKVVIEKGTVTHPDGTVTHPDGTVTDYYGKPIEQTSSPSN